MVQKNKMFDPHLLVVPVGSVVVFPNRDPFFHNVFSLFNGKRFDLGLYEAGSERRVRFDREGVSYIFCNIHPEMGAVILSLATPYYAVSREDAIVIPQVPPGRYLLNVWSEGATPESLNAARREVTVQAAATNLGGRFSRCRPQPGCTSCQQVWRIVSGGSWFRIAGHGVLTPGRREDRGQQARCVPINTSAECSD